MSTQSYKVAFLGLGVMGFPMAGHLAAKGHSVTVYNRSGAKAQEWAKQHKGKPAATPADRSLSLWGFVGSSAWTMGPPGDRPHSVLCGTSPIGRRRRSVREPDD